MFIDAFLYLEVETGGGHGGVIFHICIIYLYIKCRIPEKSAASISHSRLE